MKIKNVYFGYEKDKDLFKDLNLEIPRGKITTIIGPNGCGKSTLLGLLTKGYKVRKGEITLGQININEIKQKAFARKVAVLHQHNEENLQITIRELAAYGRAPYQRFGASLKDEDEKIIDWALECTKLTDLQNKLLSDLSGGQRQRAWLAMALCQQPEVLLLDEPTTYLDIYYQMELLDLVKELNARYQMTIVMVLHDLNQALQYSHHMIVMKDGEVIKVGSPQEVVSMELIKDVYKIKGKFHQEDDRYYLMPISTC